MDAAVIGAGPAGLMAAEALAQGGIRATVFDAMPSAGRKFLMAGRGGLNLTHSEPLPQFLARYREAAPRLAPAISAFPPDRLREWSEALSIRKEQLAAIDRIRREHDRILASLERVLGTLEAFPSLIQRLCVLERCAREDLVGDVHVELAGVSGDVTSSRQLLEGLARAPAELETGEGGRG